MFSVKVSDFSKSDLPKILKSQLNKLRWYKTKGWTKEQLITNKTFSKSFITKYFESII